MSKSFNIPKEKIALIEGLDHLVSSGLGLYESLLVLGKNPVAKDIHSGLSSGLGVADSFGRSNSFNQYEMDLIESGEKSGNLEAAFKGILDLQHFKNELRSRILSVSIYPLLVLVTALGTVIFMVGYIIPSFQEVFNQSQGDLPELTKLIFELSNVLEAWLSSFSFWLGVIFLLVFFFLYRAQLGDIMLLVGFSIPSIRTRIISLIRFSFFSIMAVQLNAGIPFVQALEQSKKFLMVKSLRNKLDTCLEMILKGMTIEESLRYMDFLKDPELALIRSGEKSNTLIHVFSGISRRSGMAIKNEVELMGKFVEPLILIVVGTIVGIILVALYLPMFQLNQIF